MSCLNCVSDGKWHITQLNIESDSIALAKLCETWWSNSLLDVGCVFSVEPSKTFNLYTPLELVMDCLAKRIRLRVYSLSIGSSPVRVVSLFWNFGRKDARNYRFLLAKSSKSTSMNLISTYYQQKQKEKGIMKAFLIVF